MIHEYHESNLGTRGQTYGIFGYDYLYSVSLLFSFLLETVFWLLFSP